jgi:TPR repeat protein
MVNTYDSSELNQDYDLMNELDEEILKMNLIEHHDKTGSKNKNLNKTTFLSKNEKTRNRNVQSLPLEKIGARLPFHEKEELKRLTHLKRISRDKSSTSDEKANATYEIAQYYKKLTDNKTQNRRKMIRYLKDAADRNHPDALHKLGKMYYRGDKGVMRRKMDGLKMIEKSALQGKLSAKVFLVQAYAKEGYFEKSIFWHKEAKDQSPMLQISVASIYERNLEKMIDYGKYIVDEEERWVGLFKLYKIEAEYGDNESMYKLSTFYQDGTGTEYDRVKAFEWSKRAAENGHIPSMLRLSKYYKNAIGTRINMKESKKWLLEYESKNDQLSEPYSEDEETLLLDEYHSGDDVDDFINYESDENNDTYSSDPDEIVNDIKMENSQSDDHYAKIKDEPIQNLINSNMKSNRNNSRIFKNFKKEAENGDENSMYKLAKCYRFGIGTPTNTEKAILLYEKLANLGFKKAEHKLDEIQHLSE